MLIIPKAFCLKYDRHGRTRSEGENQLELTYAKYIKIMIIIIIIIIIIINIKIRTRKNLVPHGILKLQNWCPKNVSENSPISVAIYPKYNSFKITGLIAS